MTSRPLRLGGNHIITHLCGVLRLELRLDVDLILPGPHAPGDILLLLVPPPSLLSSLLLAICRLLQGHPASHALRPLREMRPGLVTFESLQNG